MNALAHRPISLAILVVASALLSDSAGLADDPSPKAAGAQGREGKVTLPIAKARGFSGYPELQESVPGQCPGIYA